MPSKSVFALTVDFRALEARVSALEARLDKSIESVPVQEHAQPPAETQPQPSSEPQPNVVSQLLCSGFVASSTETSSASPSLPASSPVVASSTSPQPVTDAGSEGDADEDEDEEENEGEGEGEAAPVSTALVVPDTPPTLDLRTAEYNANDVLCTARIYRTLIDALERTDTTQVYLVDREMALLALQMTRAGLPIDRVAYKEVQDHLCKMRDDALVVLRQYTEGEYREAFVEWAATIAASKVRKGEPFAGEAQPDGTALSEELAFQRRIVIRREEFLKKHDKKGVNIGAKLQQAALLRASGVPLVKTTKKSAMLKVSKEIVEEMVQYPAARAMLDYLLTAATIKTLSGWQIDDDDRFRPEWSTTKITGRWGSSPNCFDGETEVFTPRGWVKFPDLRPDDEVQQFTPGGRDGFDPATRCEYGEDDEDAKRVLYSPSADTFAFVKPTARTQYEYTGAMTQFLDKWSDAPIDLLVTPDHRMLVYHTLLYRWYCGAASMFVAEERPADLAFPISFEGFRDVELVPAYGVKVTTVSFSGMVYCVSVPSSYIVVRRNGKIAITGNCQNISVRAGGGAENLRRTVCAPEGFKLVAADFAQLEARLLAAASSDPFLIGVFARGEDIHGALAAVAFPRDWPTCAEMWKEHKKGTTCVVDGACCAACELRDKLRDLTKRLEYGFFYGGQEAKLWASCLKEFPDLQLTDVREFIKHCSAKMPGVLKWRDRVLKQAINDCEIRSPILGRRQAFPLGRVDPTVAYNYTAQSGGADAWALGALVFCERWPQIGDDARLVQNGHDSVLVVVKDHLIDRVAQDVTECWRREVHGVPLFMEVKIGQRWSDMKKWRGA